MLINHKIVFAGPVGVGKTTSIEVISDATPLTTEAPCSDVPLVNGSTTTVTLDYGVMDLGKDEKVHLYGIPGAQRFDYMWEILAEGATGLVLLLDHSQKDPLADMELYLKAFIDLARAEEFVVGVTRMENSQYADLEKYQAKLKEMDLDVPVYIVDGRNKNDMNALVMSLVNPEQENCKLYKFGS